MPLVLTQLSSGGDSLIGLIHSRADDVNDPVVQQGQYTAGGNSRRLLLENSPRLPAPVIIGPTTAVGTSSADTAAAHREDDF